MAWLGSVGLYAVFSSTVQLSTSSPMMYLFKHLCGLAAGAAMATLIMKMPLTLFKNTAWVWLLLTIVVLFIMQMRGLTNRSYSPRTLSVFGQAIQPAEFAKIGILLYVAAALSAGEERIRKFRVFFFKLMLPVLAVCGLIFISNFSTAAIIYIVCGIVMLFGHVRLKHLGLTTLTLVAAVVIGAGLAHATTEYTSGMKRIGKPVSGFWRASDRVVRMSRLSTISTRFLDWREERSDTGNKPKRANKEQIDYAKLAIAAGGILPQVGPGNGTVKYILPQAYSDFVFAILVEELGILLVSVFVLLAFLVFLPWRIGVMVKKSNYTFATFLIIGIGLQITLQTLTHLFVCIGIFPVTGQNLPLISQGWSSILSTCIMFGLLLNVSRNIYSEQAGIIAPAEVVAETPAVSPIVDNPFYQI
jgi:cell division protein FtsW